MWHLEGVKLYGILSTIEIDRVVAHYMIKVVMAGGLVHELSFVEFA